MKKLFIIIFALIAIGLTSAQTTDYSGRFAYVDFGTVANSVTETGYVNLDRLNYSHIDSISVTAIGTGELDVDSVDIYVGTADIKHGISRYSATANTFTSTIDVNAAASAFEQLYSSDATLLTGGLLRGANSLKVVTRGSVSGNDPTDPNKLVVVFQVWGTK